MLIALAMAFTSLVAPPKFVDFHLAGQDVRAKFERAFIHDKAKTLYFSRDWECDGGCRTLTLSTNLPNSESVASDAAWKVGKVASNKSGKGVRLGISTANLRATLGSPTTVEKRGTATVWTYEWSYIGKYEMETVYTGEYWFRGGALAQILIGVYSC